MPVKSYSTFVCKFFVIPLEILLLNLLLGWHLVISDRSFYTGHWPVGDQNQMVVTGRLVLVMVNSGLVISGPVNSGLVMTGQYVFFRFFFTFDLSG